ncbi:hypothetical protein ACO1O0_007285 [Amphichorda felina]
MADSTQSTPQRRPFKGSCHCGATRYIAFLTLPHTPRQEFSPPPQGQCLYRCNCNACHKAGFLHARLNSSPDDFFLLSPLDPYTELGDYQCDGRYLHFFFCRNCGGRCFIFMGEGEVVDADLGALGVGEGTVKAWRPKKDGWKEGKVKHGCYLSVNAYTLDPDQEGLDLREWKEKKWVYYLDDLKSGQEGAGGPSYERPHPGGAY